MRRLFDTVVGAVRWQVDDVGPEVATGSKKPGRIAWDSITAAGLVQMQVAASQRDVPGKVLDGLGEGLPGLDRLLHINDSMAEEYRQLVLARGAAFSRAVRILIQIGDAEAMALVDEVRMRLGSRWKGDLSVSKSHHKELGMRLPWWTAPASVMFMVGLGYTVLFACAGFSALQEGTFDLPPVIWIGMAVWLALMGLIAFAYRRMR